MKIQKLRQKIDKLDKQIVGVLNKRANLVLEIASSKKDQGKSAYAPEREYEVLNKIKSFNNGPFPSSALEAVYREIMSYSLAIGRKLKVAYLGPQASFTNLAAIKRFGLQVEYIPCESIFDVFNSVENNQADYGVVPIENSIEGAVTHTLDMFMQSDLKICSQILQPIAHNLLAKCQLKQIKKVYSILQVFGQCRRWLQDNLPHAERIEVSSTTKAAQIVSKERNSACIASLLAAKVYKLKVLSKGIEDSPHNITRFMVIGNTQVPQIKHSRTSLLFSIKDRVGALHDMLNTFKKYKINLTKIESRPSKVKAWEYYFYVDLEGHLQDKNVSKAIADLDSKCKFLKILGSYPES
ncbi:MAG: prephenate dehydratase [Candidatus Omnitrophica bacterium]|jgi:chorismate mutase/prephenate dehydratase|nr:prephenate dehydratase [Candidatus Omnitrophota bacterium]